MSHLMKRNINNHLLSTATEATNKDIKNHRKVQSTSTFLNFNSYLRIEIIRIQSFSAKLSILSLKFIQLVVAKNLIPQSQPTTLKLIYLDIQFFPTMLKTSYNSLSTTEQTNFSLCSPAPFIYHSKRSRRSWTSSEFFIYKYFFHV